MEGPYIGSVIATPEQAEEIKRKEEEKKDKEAKGRA